MVSKPQSVLLILLSAFSVAALFDVGPAVPQTTRPSQAASATYVQAMEECKAQYGGRIVRGHVGQYRYANIEACFLAKTGKYPFQVNVNCAYRSPTFVGRTFYC